MNGLAEMKPYMQIGGSAMYDVIIVGGGIIGCSIAGQLGKEGKTGREIRQMAQQAPPMGL